MNCSDYRVLARILKLGAQNGNCIKTFRCLTYQGRPQPQYTKITNINMYLLIEIRLNICKQFHGNYVEVEKRSITCLKLIFVEITHNENWVS